MVDILEKSISNKIKISMPHLYRSWDEYVKHFCMHGGIIEASPICLPNQISSPCISFFLSPDGEVELIGSFDWFTGKEYINVGAFFP